MALRVTHGTTVAGTPAFVVLNNVYNTIDVVNRGGGDLFIRTDGQVAAVGADENDVVPAGGRVTLPVYANQSWSQGEGNRPANTTVSIVSAAAVTWSLVGDD